MKRKVIIALLIVFVAASAATTWYVMKGRNKQVITFVTVKPQYGYIGKSVTATGSIQPVDTVCVGAQVSGVVQSIFADFNSVVKKGQLLAKIDPAIIIAQTEQAKASLANAQSNMRLQQTNYDRQKQLFDFGAISKADYQIALNLRQSAKTDVDNFTAELKITLRTLSYTNIYSPITGVVLNRNVSAGQTIASNFNAPTLFVIAKDLTKMNVRAAVDEADIGGVRLGQNATFTVDAFPGIVFQGNVHDILLHPSVSAGVVTYTTLITVDNKDLKLKPGMTASINIFSQEDSNALLIPSRALSFKPDSTLLKKYKIQKAARNQGNTEYRLGTSKPNQGNENDQQSFVWIKTGDTLVERPIITGINDDAYVKVISGISPNDEVITNINSGSTSAKQDATQRSPFMPQQHNRPKSGARASN
ncbi:MAG: efflux RND transporter periplasmic adaptor subunit [Bacteroidota bacterium]|uniref:efflux RND transporter periplasmic adaptor subunit n=1 Tax=Runella sp. TaxID=1960881 RepID=UPI003017A0D9